MDIFSKLRQIFTPSPQEPDMVHEYFGDLHSEAIGDKDDFWQAELIFEPTGQEICLNINAGLEGPSDGHVKFYEWFKENYETEFLRVSSFLIDEYETWFKKKMEGPFIKDFEFSSLTLPRDGNIQNNWEIAFECMADPDQHLFTVELVDNEIRNVRADG